MNHRDTQLRRHPLYVVAQVLRGSSLAAFAVAVLALLLMLLGDSQGGASRIAWIGGAIAFALSLYASRLEGQAEKAVAAEVADNLSDLDRTIQLDHPTSKLGKSDDRTS